MASCWRGQVGNPKRDGRSAVGLAHDVIRHRAQGFYILNGLEGCLLFNEVVCARRLIPAAE